MIQDHTEDQGSNPPAPLRTEAREGMLVGTLLVGSREKIRQLENFLKVGGSAESCDLFSPVLYF